LLSDLGNHIFARGSETDAWFESLGQECIERRVAAQRRVRHSSIKEKRKSAKAGLQQKQRVIEKKKSFGDLRGAGSTDPIADKPQQSPPITTPSPEVASTATPGNDSSATSDTISARSQSQAHRKDATPEFPFMKAYQRLLRMFCVHPNPYAKLNALFELEHLIVASLNSGSRKTRLAWARPEFGSSSSATEDHGTVRTGAKPLEDTIDNVKERRSHTLMQSPTFSPTGQGRVSGGAGNMETRSVVSVAPANTDAIANVLQSLFRDPSLRPKSLFRDLQFIASFVPASILDKTEKGKAFWDTGLAALGLKGEVCRTMVEVADEIVKQYTQTRKGTVPVATNQPGSAASSATSAATSEPSPSGQPTTSNSRDEPLLSPPPLPPTTYSLADAARMWTITAKEGDPTAQRELALFYLSNPELVQRSTQPLSRPREVFKQAVMEKYGGGSTRGPGGSGARYHPGGASAARSLGQTQAGAGAGLSIGLSGGSGPGTASNDGTGDVRSDPALMCVAIHWMEAAEQGGDELARQFLGQNEIVGLG
jgi:hypothetical protein